MVALLACLPTQRRSAGPNRAASFPRPEKWSPLASDFLIDSGAVILIPAHPSEQDEFLANSLANELGDRYGVHLKTERTDQVDSAKRVILIGSITNPLVRRRCAEQALDISATKPGAGRIRTAGTMPITFSSQAATTDGAFYGLQSLRQLAQLQGGKLRYPGVQIRDWPDKPFRAIRLFLPGRANIAYFKRFVRDFMALYKYNTLVMEMNASMRFDRHPELNQAWPEFFRDTTYSRRNYPPGNPNELEQNSSHHDAADGGFLEKEEVADLARWIRRHHIELVPELPSFTHSYYLLSRHPDLAEVPGEKWPDTYCPSNPKSYELLFDVYDEYIEVLKPKLIHAGHDELFIPVDLCPRCKGKDIGSGTAGTSGRSTTISPAKGFEWRCGATCCSRESAAKGCSRRKLHPGGPTTRLEV